jgi:hypothetical protein
MNVPPVVSRNMSACRRYGSCRQCLLQGIVLAVMLSLGIGCRSAGGATGPASPDSTALQPIAIYSLTISEPSGLAFSHRTNSLYLVSDGDSAIYRIDTTGKVLEVIPVNARSLEGIAASPEEDTLYVVEESR